MPRLVACERRTTVADRHYEHLYIYMHNLMHVHLACSNGLILSILLHTQNMVLAVELSVFKLLSETNDGRAGLTPYGY